VHVALHRGQDDPPTPRRVLEGKMPLQVLQPFLRDGRRLQYVRQRQAPRFHQPAHFRHGRQEDRLDERLGRRLARGLFQPRQKVVPVPPDDLAAQPFRQGQRVPAGIRNTLGEQRLVADLQDPVQGIRPPVQQQVLGQVPPVGGDLGAVHQLHWIENGEV